MILVAASGAKTVGDGCLMSWIRIMTGRSRAMSSMPGGHFGRREDAETAKGPIVDRAGREHGPRGAILGTDREGHWRGHKAMSRGQVGRVVVRALMAASLLGRIDEVGRRCSG